MPTFRRALLAALVLLPSVLAVAGAAECVQTPGPDGWSRVAPAAFSAGDPVLTGFAVAARDPDLMVVTNGVALQASTDHGCTWQPVAMPADALLDPVTGDRTVVEVEAAPVRGGAEPLWVLAQTNGTVARPLAYRADDFTAPLTGPGLGLPLTGTARSLAAAADGSTAYVVVDVPAAGKRLYVTVDGGATWNGADTAGGFAYDSLAVDATNPEHLFAWSADRLAESWDAGATFSPNDLPDPGLIRDVVVAPSARADRIAVLLENGVLLRSDDGGNDWQRRTVDARADQVAVVPDLDVAAVAGHGLVTVLPGVFRAIDASPDGAEPLDLTLSLGTGGAVQLAGRDDLSVMVHVGTVVEDAVPDVDLKSALVVPVGPALVPREVSVTLAPGETRDVDYVMDLPATPSPIEVFFLIDTTGSMGFVIDGIRDGLAKMVNDLALAGIPARFGVGEVKEYPIQPYSGGDDLPYRLLRKVGPVDAELEAALAELQASGGGDGPESMTTGFYQLATGAGDVVNGETMVPRGADAGFGDGVLRIVVASTDNEYHQESGYPGPLKDVANAVLAREGINVIGISAGRSAKPDLVVTATTTRTFAPRHGTDCDLDGRVDVAEGDPLVCDIVGGAQLNVGGGGIKVDTDGARGVGNAVVTLLRGFRDPATFTLRSSAPDVARVLGDAAVAVDRKLPYALPYRVRLACPPARYGTTTDAAVTGAVGARALGTSAVRVRCLAPAVPASAPRPVAEFADPPEPAKPAAAVAAVPPAPVQAVHQANPNPNPQPHANTNAQLQAGAAQQRQEQFQLALAHTGSVDGEAEELAMVRRDPPALVLPAAAGLMAAAAGAAWRHRSAPALATVRRRRGSC